MAYILSQDEIDAILATIIEKDIEKDDWPQYVYIKGEKVIELFPENKIVQELMEQKGISEEITDYDLTSILESKGYKNVAIFPSKTELGKHFTDVLKEKSLRPRPDKDFVRNWLNNHPEYNL